MRDYPFAHPLKVKFRQLGLRLYDITAYLNISESKLSRCLNGIDQMSNGLEERLYEVYEFLKERLPNKSS